MVHLGILVGTSGQVAQAEAHIQQASAAWIRLAPKTWLFVDNEGAVTWRDYLRANVPGIQLVIMRLNGEWGTLGLNEVRTWLQGAGNEF